MKFLYWFLVLQLGAINLLGISDHCLGVVVVVIIVPVEYEFKLKDFKLIIL